MARGEQGDDDPRSAYRERFRAVRARVGRLVSTNYDISSRCNMRCEGCLFFAGDDYKQYRPEADLARWDDFFRAEAARGVNFGYFAGAEPSLELERLRAAHRHIARGVVFTNGTVRIPDDVTYRLHVSLWGDDAASIKLRGAGTAKALRNYAGDPRAIFVFTVTAHNIAAIVPVTEAVVAGGGTITFSLFSPPEGYLDARDDRSTADARYFRLVDGGAPAAFGAEELAEIGQQIAIAAARFGAAVRYSPHYHAWIARPGGVHEIDAETGIALDCGNRLTDHHRHYNVDLTVTRAKCCSPNLDCRECRAYAMGYATYLKTVVDPRWQGTGVPDWLAVWETWADLFVGDG